MAGAAERPETLMTFALPTPETLRRTAAALCPVASAGVGSSLTLGWAYSRGRRKVKHSGHVRCSSLCWSRAWIQVRPRGGSLPRYGSLLWAGSIPRTAARAGPGEFTVPGGPGCIISAGHGATRPGSALGTIGPWQVPPCYASFVSNVRFLKRKTNSRQK